MFQLRNNSSDFDVNIVLDIHTDCSWRSLIFNVQPSAYSIISKLQTLKRFGATLSIFIYIYPEEYSMILDHLENESHTVCIKFYSKLTEGKRPLVRLILGWILRKQDGEHVEWMQNTDQ